MIEKEINSHIERLKKPNHLYEDFSDIRSDSLTKVARLFQFTQLDERIVQVYNTNACNVN